MNIGLYYLHLLIPHKKVSQDLTKKKQDLTEMSIILMVLRFEQDFVLARFYHNQLRNLGLTQSIYVSLKN